MRHSHLRFKNASSDPVYKQALENSILGYNEYHTLDKIKNWIQYNKERTDVHIEHKRFSQLEQWFYNEAMGSICHKSGGFFRIDGISVQTNYGAVTSWEQPIINQPEIGFLGILVKNIKGTLHFLLQAKIEPGNINHVQISPTLQATKSNFLRKHKGLVPRYLDYFQDPFKMIILDQLQSEQGARFLRKRNRNIIIYVEDNIEVYENFCWMTLNQIKQLTKMNNTINMDTRTVLSGIQYINIFDDLTSRKLQRFELDILHSEKSNFSLYSQEQLISWLTNLKSTFELSILKKPLYEVNNWVYTDEKIAHKSGRYFEIIPIRVVIPNREVTSWDQPLIKPCQPGICAFFIKKFQGVYHFLVQAKLECGNFDVLELAPTIQCITGSYKDGDVPYVQDLEKALQQRKGIRLDVFQSEEGGRFFGEQNRNLIIEVDDTFQEIENPRYIWMSLGQLKNFIQYNNYVNIQARTLLAQL